MTEQKKPLGMNNLPRVVAFTGDIGAGKDSAAAWLIKGLGYRPVSFAFPLKKALLDVYGPLGMEERHAFGTQEDKNEPIGNLLSALGEPMTFRHAAEQVGTQGYRSACPETWILLAEYQIHAELAAGVPGVAITDARFFNEFDVVRRVGGVVLRVVKYGTTSQRTGHVSDEEWRSLKPDAQVGAKHGDIAGLHREVEQALVTLGKERKT